jgi:hypothetical protein
MEELLLAFCGVELGWMGFELGVLTFVLKECFCFRGVLGRMAFPI